MRIFPEHGVNQSALFQSVISNGRKEKNCRVIKILIIIFKEILQHQSAIFFNIFSAHFIYAKKDSMKITRSLSSKTAAASNDNF